MRALFAAMGFDTIWTLESARLATDGRAEMKDSYFLRYLPLLIHTLVAIAMAVGMVVLSWFLGKHKPNRAKMSPYECGIESASVEPGRNHFSVKFYMVAMLFILFDVEAVFLYPWAILLRELKHFGFWEMLVYIAIVLVGYLYIWKKGVLDWSKPSEHETL
jgi:NADH-quinone oxidoreductase subunit A